MQLIIRAVLASDAPAVAPLVAQLGFPTTPEQAVRRLERLGRDADTRVLAAVVGDTVAGLGVWRLTWLLEHDEPVGQLLALVVDERQRARGVGRALVAAIEAEACRRGCYAVVLNSSEHRAGAHRFYENLGYRNTGRRFMKELTA